MWDSKCPALQDKRELDSTNWSVFVKKKSIFCLQLWGHIWWCCGNCVVPGSEFLHAKPVLCPFKLPSQPWLGFVFYFSDFNFVFIFSAIRNNIQGLFLVDAQELLLVDSRDYRECLGSNLGQLQSRKWPICCTIILAPDYYVSLFWVLDHTQSAQELLLALCMGDHMMPRSWYQTQVSFMQNIISVLMYHLPSHWVHVLFLFVSFCAIHGSA